jgi:hypothetical protein
MRALILAATLLLAGCQTYLVSTNFYQLERGITKQQFLAGWQSKTDAKHIIGGRPVSSQSFRVGQDVWEVWIYSVYSTAGGAIHVDHQEYLAFKNNRLEEWGLGTLPLTLRDNPNRVDVHVDH